MYEKWANLSILLYIIFFLGLKLSFIIPDNEKVTFYFYMHQKNRKISGDLMEDNRRSFTKLSDGYV